MLDWFSTVDLVTFASTFVRAIVIVVVGFLGSRAAGSLAHRLLSRDGRMERAILARRVVSIGILILAGLTAMSELGFDLSILLGAAGVTSVAIGFASQTSASNIISGFFLIAERPFSVGDIIDIGGQAGVVLEIDLMSIKMRTFDNRFVRIPNESVMKMQVINITRFPIRRLDLSMNVPHTVDLPRVQSVLAEVAAATTLVLDEPKPEVMISGISAGGTDLLLLAWVDRTNFVAVRNDLILQIHKRFREEKIDLSPRQKTVLTQS